MTRRLYLEDAYCFEHVAAVIEVSAGEIALDRTCMYPGGGGQPPDTGWIEPEAGDPVRLIGVRKDAAGTLWHACGELPGSVAAGQGCVVRLDAERRLRLMRFHTALHVFNTVMLRGYGAWITGVRMDAARSHIDFKMDYAADMRARIEDEVNEVIARGLAVEAYTISAEEFRGRADLLRTLEAEVPVEGERVRVVAIRGFEEQACGGTHVHETGEVGLIRIVKVDNKGRQNRRFYVELVEW